MLLEMKHKRTSLVILIILMCGAAAFLAVGLFANQYLVNQSAVKNKASNCSLKLTNHLVTIQNDILKPVHTTAVRCDTLTIINKDDKLREIGFGVHDHHLSYNEVSERNLEQGQSFTITLDQTGKYKFHDHFQDEVAGDFTVVN
jgi:hypothetical protein